MADDSDNWIDFIAIEHHKKQARNLNKILGLQEEIFAKAIAKHSNVNEKELNMWAFKQALKEYKS